VPYLAGTYDERMYEELRLRAQTFEVLTGGDLSAHNAEGDEQDSTEPGSLSLIPLPDSMVEDLRVSLHIWSEPERDAASSQRTSIADTNTYGVST
jgi:hypothetical protein